MVVGLRPEYFDMSPRIGEYPWLGAWPRYVPAASRRKPVGATAVVRTPGSTLARRTDARFGVYERAFGSRAMFKMVGTAWVGAPPATAALTSS